MKKIVLLFINLFSLTLVSCKQTPPGIWNDGFPYDQFHSYQIALSSNQTIFDLTKEDLVLDLYLGFRQNNINDILNYFPTILNFNGIYVQDIPYFSSIQEYTTDYENGDYSHIDHYALLQEINYDSFLKSCKEGNSYYSSRDMNFYYKTKLVFNKSIILKLLENNEIINFISLAWIWFYKYDNDKITHIDFFCFLSTADISISKDLIVTLY